MKGKGNYKIREGKRVREGERDVLKNKLAERDPRWRPLADFSRKARAARRGVSTYAR